MSIDGIRVLYCTRLVHSRLAHFFHGNYFRSAVNLSGDDVLSLQNIASHFSIHFSYSHLFLATIAAFEIHQYLCLEHFISHSFLHIYDITGSIFQRSLVFIVRLYKLNMIGFHVQSTLWTVGIAVVLYMIYPSEDDSKKETSNVSIK